MAGAVRERRSGAGARRRGDAVGTLALLALLLGGAALGYVLRELAGGPRAPDGAHIREVLSGTELADSDVVAATAALAWLMLAYLSLSVGLRLALLLAGRLSGGARWARTALRLSNLVTIPAVRRVVDGGVAGTLLAASWLPLPSQVEGGAGPAYAAAAAAPPPLVAWADAPPLPAEAAPEAPSPPCVLYTVAPGDDLWDVARRCYGDGSRFVEIFEASRGLPMEGGERVGDPRLIRPGWVLRVPMPALSVDAGDDVTTYRVRRGDHLWGIAERFLGDGFRWVEIWERNSGREVEAGSRLTDPNQIYPGWLLELPVRDGEAALPAEARAPAALPAPLPVESAAQRAFADAPAGAAVGAGTVASEGAAEDADADAARGGGGGWDWEWPHLPRTVTWSAAGFVVIGGTALFVQRLHRAGSLRLRPRAGRGGDGPGDAGRVALATAALGTALADLGFAGSMPLLVFEGGSGLQFTVACPPGDAGALLAARHDLERRLGCDVEAAADGPTRVALTLCASGRPPGALAEAPYAAPALVVPVGANDAGVVYLNLAVAGSVTVTGTAGERRALLRSWVATLQTTCAPDELSFRVDAAAAGLLDADAGLLYFGDAAGAHGAADLADELDEIIQTRSSGGGVSRPLVAVFDPAGSGEDVPAGAMRYGPAAGVFVICCLPPSESADPLTDSGAVVAFGAAGDGADGDADAVPPGAIVLRTGRDEPLLLEPVHVRRDTSARWSESADPPALTDFLGRMSGNLPPPREAAPRISADGRPLSGDAREGDADDLGTVALGAALAHPVMPHDPLAGFSANGGGGRDAETWPPVPPDGEPDLDLDLDLPEPVPAAPQAAGCEDGRVRSAAPPEQPGAAPAGAIPSGGSPQAHGPETPPEPQPGAAAAGAIPSGGSPQAHGPATPPEPQPGAAAAGAIPSGGFPQAHGPETPPEPQPAAAGAGAIPSGGSPPDHGPATPPEPQPGAASAGAIPSGGSPPDHGPATPPEPQPGAAGAGGAGRPAPAIRQSALLTHDDLSPAAEVGPPAAQAVFTVRCLGPFELRFGATPVAGWPVTKSRELLAFLATQGGRPVPRESVAEALWPDYPWDASLRHTIANAVSSLRGVVRSAAGDDELQPVVTVRQRYELQTALFRIDLDEFESALRRAAALPDVDALAEYERAAALCRGDFLKGEPFPWLDAYRADYRRRVSDGASRGAAVAERLGERERASLLYRVVLEQEPTDEAAARGLMRHLAAARDANGVRKVFKVLTEALKRELDDPQAAPGQETRELLAALLAREPGAVV